MSGYVIEIPQENMDKNMLARQLRVAAYCRVSTTYEEQKHSLDAQIRYYTQYIQQNPRWKFVAVYADQASGLHTKNRPGYQQMLRDCRRGKIDLILVKTLSRFGRDALETISQIRRLKEMNKKKQSLRSKVSYVRKNWQLYIFFLMPALLLTIIFKYIPMGGLLIAFEDYNVIKGVFGSPWVGLEYFQRFLSSPDFMNYLMNTLKLSIYGLLWGFPIPIILALLLNRIRKEGIKKKIQLLIYAPNFISVIVLCGMVRMLLSPVGPLNRILGLSTNWMTMPSAFRTIYIASGIWQGAGWASIMYTAALSNASKELEEAATMDGANLLQQIWYVELPAIKNIIVIQFILQAGNIMSIGFEKAYALQTDMNLPASEILSTYVYRIGLLNGDYGYSTAVGLFNSVVNVILLIIVNAVVKKLNDGEGI